MAVKSWQRASTSFKSNWRPSHMVLLPWRERCHTRVPRLWNCWKHSTNSPILGSGPCRGMRRSRTMSKLFGKRSRLRVKGLSSVFRAVLRKSADTSRSLSVWWGHRKGSIWTHLSILLAWLGRQGQLPCPGWSYLEALHHLWECLPHLLVDIRCLRHLSVDTQCLRDLSSNACGSRCGAAPAANVTGFFVHGLLPRTSRWTASHCPDGYFNSQSENWDSHEGRKQWRFTNAVTHSLSWRPGFSHYGPVGPEWAWHAERRQAAVPP